MNRRPYVRSKLVAGGLACLLAALPSCGGDDGPVDVGGDAPTLVSVVPASGMAGTTVSVTLTGTNFATGAGNTAVTVSGGGVTVSGVDVSGSTSLTADFVLAETATAGDRNVTVTTDAGTSGMQTFTVEAAPLSGNVSVAATDNLVFDPADITVESGTTVTWENTGTVAHTVTPDSGDEWTGTQINGGETFAHTFDTPGTYPYHCNFHSGMDGTVTVVSP